MGSCITSVGVIDTAPKRISQQKGVMGSMKFVVILGSVREGRVGDRIAKLFMSEIAAKAPNINVELIDAAEAALPVVNRPLHFYPDPAQAPSILHKLNEKVMEADGFIIISAEYNRQVCPGMLNLLNHLPPPSFEYKPSGIVCYSMGPTAGAFAAAGLRPFLAEMGCLPVKHMTLIPMAHNAVDDEGATEDVRITGSLTKLISQVEWWAAACKDKRNADGVPST